MRSARKLLTVAVMALALTAMTGCEEFELEDVNIDLGGLLRPLVLVDRPAYPVYEEVVVEEVWYDDYFWWP